MRDRDAIITSEGLIFRVLGYSHPPNKYVCDAEYAPAAIFKSDNPKAPREGGSQMLYKFYEDEGWKFIHDNFSEYMIFHEMLRTEVLGVHSSDISEYRRPSEKLEALIEIQPQDELLAALQDVLSLVTIHSSLNRSDFGVFGSILHDFYHPKLSDLDFTVYGSQNLHKLCVALRELYNDKFTVLENEFENDDAVKGKHWKFKNYSLLEYVWHQQRKMIYALFDYKKSGRVIKTEFEPVKNWEEIKDRYDIRTKIVHKGWTRMRARVI
ncbi:MAG: hypothetical protein GWO20_10195, partial [Candidatus Korarchaeota archaeon]|nr:hypothetical protein [Candidatus Korarchaeota archaeon]